jgi:hypothetical protein
MYSIGAGNSMIQAAHLFKSANHSPSDSDEEPDNPALENVKFPSDSPSIEKVYEEETAAAEYQVSIADPWTGSSGKKKSKKSKAPAPAPAPESFVPVDDWGFSVPKMKKQRAIEPM